MLYRTAIVATGFILVGLTAPAAAQPQPDPGMPQVNPRSAAGVFGEHGQLAIMGEAGALFTHTSVGGGRGSTTTFVLRPAIGIGHEIASITRERIIIRNIDRDVIDPWRQRRRPARLPCQRSELRVPERSGGEEPRRAGRRRFRRSESAASGRRQDEQWTSEPPPCCRPALPVAVGRFQVEAE